MSADNQIRDILAKYGEDFASNTWVVPGGKARAIYHKTIERMAAKAGIYFDKPEMISADPANVVLIVYGTLWTKDDEGKGYKLQEWSFGEANPKNNKNAYPYSMAEKRAKDRVALKLIGLHGLVYSEEEAEDFKKPADAAGRGGGDLDSRETSPPPSDRTIANALILSLKSAKNEVDLRRWYRDNEAAIDALPDDLKDEVRAAYSAKLHDLRSAA